MSQADSNASYLLLFVFACIGLALALAIFQGSKEEIPETLYPDITYSTKIQK